jgi:SWI/SNF-related matrix-associated actin-dependent regulator of chromatin subfamily B member 1
MIAKYPDDRFDIVTRAAVSGEQEWRVKCLDCPGKVCNLMLCLRT